MKHVHMFSWNIPKDNQFTGRTDRYINIIAEWNGDCFYNDGRPMIYVNPVNLSFGECISVKDWYLAKSQIENIAQNHFAELARKERTNKARAELIAAGIDILLPASIDNPVLERYEADLLTQQTLS